MVSAAEMGVWYGLDLRCMCGYGHAADDVQTCVSWIGSCCCHNLLGVVQTISIIHWIVKSSKRQVEEGESVEQRRRVEKKEIKRTREGRGRTCVMTDDFD